MLLLAFRSIAIEEMGAAPEVSAEQEHAIARHLIRVAIASRAGQLEAEQYVIRTDPEVEQALRMLDEMRAAP